MTDRRSIIAGSIILAGTSVLGFALFSPTSDEERITDLFERLETTLSYSHTIENVLIKGAELSAQFSELFSETFEFQAPSSGFALPSGRKQLAFASAKLMQRYSSASLRFTDVRLKISGVHARAKTLAKLRAQGRGPHGIREENLDIVLSKKSGEWLINSVMVVPSTQ